MGTNMIIGPVIGGVPIGSNVNLFDKLINDGNTVAWYDYQATDTITNDGLNAVSRWNDKLGSGRDLIQASGTSQPLLTTDGVLFDGVDDFLKTTSFPLVQPVSMYLVLSQKTWVANRTILDGSSATTLLNQRTASPSLTAYAGAFTLHNEDLIVDKFGVIRLLWNSTLSKFRVDGNTPVLRNVGLNNFNGITIGSQYNGVANSNIIVKECIFRNVKDTSFDDFLIYKYLNAKHNIAEQVNDPQTVVTFVSDDGMTGDLTLLKPLFDTKGVKGVSAISSAKIAEAGYMTASQISELHAAGWEIASHGKNHVRLDTLNEADARIEINDSFSELNAFGFECANFIYPYGATGGYEAIVAENYNSAATVQNGINIPLSANKYLLKRVALGSYFSSPENNTYEYYKSKVDEAISDWGWVVFMLHPSAAEHDATQQQALSDIIDYVKSKQVAIKTIKEALTHFSL